MELFGHDNTAAGGQPRYADPSNWSSVHVQVGVHNPDKMKNPFVLRLEHGTTLTDDDRAMLISLTRKPRTYGKSCTIVHAGDRSDRVQIVLQGFACRYKLLANGRRQITALLVPGDFCDLNATLLDAMDHNIATLSDCVIAEIPHATVEELHNSLRIMSALWWATLVDAAISREWLVNLGQRSAIQKVAHLFCELYVRLNTVGLVLNGSFHLPISQENIGDTLGLTNVHVNRTLQSLRAQGLITFKSHKLKIIDFPRLKLLSEFQDGYLHLKK